MAIVGLELVAATLEQALPIKFLRNRRALMERWPALLVRHLEEEQKRQLLDVISVGQPIVAQDIAVVPEFLNDLVRVLSHHVLYRFQIMRDPTIALKQTDRILL
jgi:hypothetical protein